MNLTRARYEKPVAEDVQAVTALPSDPAGQNLQRKGTPDSSKPVINPRPALSFERTEQIPNRYVFCRNYDFCLNFAISQNWESFDCEACSNFEFLKCSPDKWLAESVGCWELIDALEVVESF
jgi:hypothetical protein